ncbi:hypothetical protein BK649_17315 [Pseudomonas canadensis]|uniref:Type III secretion protein n=2 Tax=Pseudomonas canadensis TaxID=915099 RepID=A0A423F6V9_9PSED|nr:hypothetical protein BK649_17315 [Pseudomonas canadensis]
MGSGGNVGGGAPSNQGLDQQIQDLQRKIKDMQSQGVKGGQGSQGGGELDELMKLLEKLLKQKNDQGAQGNQGAQDGQGRGQGQIQMPETQGSGKVGG